MEILYVPRKRLSPHLKFMKMLLGWPLLLPAWSLNTVHSSIVPNDWNSSLTSSSFCCLFSIPTNSFRSSATPNHHHIVPIPYPGFQLRKHRQTILLIVLKIVHYSTWNKKNVSIQIRYFHDIQWYKYVSFMLTGTTFAVSRFHLNGSIHLQHSIITRSMIPVFLQAYYILYTVKSWTDCYCNGSDSPHRRRAPIVQSYLPGGTHMNPYLIIVPSFGSAVFAQGSRSSPARRQAYRHTPRYVKTRAGTDRKYSYSIQPIRHKYQELKLIDITGSKQAAPIHLLSASHTYWQ